MYATKNKFFESTIVENNNNGTAWTARRLILLRGRDFFIEIFVLPAQ